MENTKTIIDVKLLFRKHVMFFENMYPMLLFACGFKLYGLAEIVHTQLLMDGN